MHNLVSARQRGTRNIGISSVRKPPPEPAHSWQPRPARGPLERLLRTLPSARSPGGVMYELAWPARHERQVAAWFARNSATGGSRPKAESVAH